MRVDNGQLYTNLNSSGAKLVGADPVKLILNNTTYRAGHIGQFISSSSNLFEIEWYNTASALAGAIFPTILFEAGNGSMLGTLRGVDVSSVTGTLFSTVNANRLQEWSGGVIDAGLSMGAEPRE